MKRITLILALLMIAGALFALGTVKSTTAFDADAETASQTIDASIVLGPVTIGNKIVLTALGAEDRIGEETIDWTGSVDYAVNEAISMGFATSYGIDSVDKVPITLKAAWTISPAISVNVKYVNDNVNADEVETGTVTIEAKLSF